MFRFLSIITILLLLVSCSKNKYKENQRDENSLRLVSLAQSVTKELVSLDLKDNIVGATSYCDITANNKDLIVGDATTVNIEKILLLKPDIVFASGLTKDNTITALKNNGIKVYTTGKMESFDVICEHFLELGKLVGKEDLSRSMISKSRNKIDSLVSSLPKHKDSLKVFIQIGTKPIFTVIPNTFMNDYITLAGCENIASDLKRGTITRETVLKRNPDVIFIVTMGILGENEKNNWQRYSELNATKNNKIFMMDSNLASTPTVLSFTKSFEFVINKLYYNE